MLVNGKGVKWLALNVGDHSPSDWHITRARAAQFGVKIYPWARLAHPNLGENYTHARAKMNVLAWAGNDWGSDFIVPNYEDEATSIVPPSRALEALSLSGWNKQVAWSTQGWLPNGVDYKEIYNHPVLLQIFPSDLNWQPSDVKEKTIHCIQHARGLDNSVHRFTYVGVTYQVYGNTDPSWYYRDGTYSVYTGNVLAGGKWPQWFTTESS